MIGVLMLWAQVAPVPAIDTNYRKEVMALLGKHMGDPRNSRYCRVTVMAERPYPAGFVEVEVVGFVSEADSKSAVLWDGLRYPIVRILGPADLALARRAARAATAWPPADRPMAAYSSKKHNYGFEWVMGSPAAPGIWMLIGEERMATDLLARQATWSVMVPSDADDRLKHWIASRLRARFYDLFHNAQDREALTVLEREVALGLQPKWNSSVGKYNTTEQLMIEMKRRLASTATKPNVGAETVDGIIQSLEHIRQMPNWSPSFDKIFDHAVAKGPELVPALIAAIGSDVRLTRAQVPSRNFPDLSIASVKKASEMILHAIWPEYQFVQEKSPQDLLAVWEKVRGLPRPDQMIVFLEDQSLPNYTRLAALANFAPYAPLWTTQERREARLASARLYSRINAAVRPLVEADLSKMNREASSQEKTRAMEWVTTYARWDWESAKDLYYRALDGLTPTVARNAPHQDLIQRFLLVGIENGAEEPFARYLELTRNPDLFLDQTKLAMRVLRFAQRPEMAELLSQYGAAFRSPSEPNIAIARLSEMFRGDTSDAIASSDFREFLLDALANQSSCLVNDGPSYTVPLGSGKRHIDMPTGPAVKAIRVCDYAAYQLCRKFKTGIDFSFTATRSIRDRTCSKLRDWINGAS